MTVFQKDAVLRVCYSYRDSLRGLDGPAISKVKKKRYVEIKGRSAYENNVPATESRRLMALFTHASADAKRKKSHQSPTGGGGGIGETPLEFTLADASRLNTKAGSIFSTSCR